LNLVLICVAGVLDHLQISQSEVVVAVSIVALVMAEVAKEAGPQLQDVVAHKVVATAVETTQIVHSVKSASSMDTLSRDVGIDLMKIMSLSKGRKGTQLQSQQVPT
jgi:hypothetical protein